MIVFLSQLPAMQVIASLRHIESHGVQLVWLCCILGGGEVLDMIFVFRFTVKPF